MKKRIIAKLAAMVFIASTALLAGCAKRPCTIIEVYQAETANDGTTAKNWRTAFKFEDGQVVTKVGKYGSVGETVTMQIDWFGDPM